MPLGGYANRVARVDLTAGTVAYEPIPEEWARKYSTRPNAVVVDSAEQIVDLVEQLVRPPQQLSLA